MVRSFTRARQGVTVAAKKSAAKSKPVKSKALPAKKVLAPKKAAAAKVKDSVAVKALGELPPLNELRRRVYLATFTEAQCEAWGARTKATEVAADAAKAIGAFLGAAKKGIDGYAVERFAWLCTQVVELEDAIVRQSSDAAGSPRSSHAAVKVARRIRMLLAHGLLNVAGGNETFAGFVHERNDQSDSPSALETSITGLLQMALSARRTPEGELLANDAGLTEEFLSSASAVAESLSASNQQTWTVATGQDTQETDRVEGRVLRELSLLRTAVHHAKVTGQALPNFPTLPVLSGAAPKSAPAPTPAIGTPS